MNSRNKGNSFERKIAQEIRDQGYSCVTSRSESKSLDDAGIDLVDDTPFYFQLKKTERLPNLHKVLYGMPKEKTRCIIHAKNNQQPLITLSWDDFKRLLL